MNSDWLLKHFDQISEAPDAVPRLRRFILDLAVRGKLLEQDPKDEPASELLKRIQANGDHGSNDGERKNQNSLPAIETGEIALEIPENWVLARVGELLDIQYGKALPAADRSLQGSVAVYGSNGVVGYCEATLAQEPAIIIGRKGSAGALNLCNGPSWTTDVAYFLIPPAFFNIRFLFVALQTLDLARLGKGVKPGLNRSEAYQLPIVVPPLAEQHRIVAKVDELMALCDELEAAQTKRERRRDRLVAATLHGLNNGNDSLEPGARPIFEKSARFYFNHLPRLTTRPEHIHQLRQTILNLAVRGKLVPQDLKDEPASELMKGIEVDKAQLIKEGNIRNQKALPPIGQKDVPFDLPGNWEWVRLGDVCFTITDGAHHTPHYTEKGVPFLSVKDVSSGKIDFSNTRFISQESHNELCRRCKPESGDILLTKVGTTGIAVAVNTSSEFSIFVSIALLKFPISEILQPFLVHLLNSPFVRKQSAENTQGIGNKNLVLRLINLFAIPLPPLAEQHRIVAKVDELMALCDELEARVTTTATTRHQFLDATLHEAL